MDNARTPTVPTFEDRQLMWRTLDFAPLQWNHPNVDAYISALTSRFVNGIVTFASFRIPEHPTFDWYLERNRLHDCNFFEQFWLTPSPTRILSIRPEPLNYYESSLFSWITPFHLSGELSSVLFSGGAYSRSEGYGYEAKRLGEAAATELLAGDYETTLCYHCNFAWSGFFMDVAWDFTWVVISKPKRQIHVLLATDTD